MLEVENTDNNNWIDFDDSTGTVIPYYKSWLLVQYSLDIRKMRYDQLLKDNTEESALRNEMMAWYNANKRWQWAVSRPKIGVYTIQSGILSAPTFVLKRNVIHANH